MKTMIATVVAAMFALNVAAYNTGVDPGNYCVKSIHGKMVVEKNGSEITKEITFSDGSRLEPNGAVHLSNGNTVMLKEGECVNETSVLNLDKHGKDNWFKKDTKDKDLKDHTGTKEKEKTKITKPEKKESDKDFEYDYPKK